MGGNQGGVEQYSTKTPAQEQFLYNQFKNNIETDPLYKSGSSYLQNLLSGAPNATAEFNAPYLQQFQQQIVPGLSERFAGMGTGAGALASSGFNQTMAQAGSGLQSTLAALRQQLMGQASQQALGYAQQPWANKYQGLQTNAFENVNTPDTPGFLGTFGPALLQGALTAFGGPAGAAIGAGIGGLSGLTGMTSNTGNVLMGANSAMSMPGMNMPGF